MTSLALVIVFFLTSFLLSVLADSSLTSTGLTANKTDAEIGETITWTADATGGGESYRYCFYVFKNGKIEERGSYGADSSYSYSPTVAGTYSTRIYIKDTYGTASSTESNGVRVTTSLTITSVESDVDSGLDGGNTIVTWKAVASGTGTLQYRFYIFMDGKLADRGSWGTENTYSYSPLLPGVYTARVYVKDAYGPTMQLDSTSSVGIYPAFMPEPLVINSIESMTTNDIVGQPVTWKANATGGVGALEYCFYIFRNGKIEERGAWGSEESINFTPMKPGTYTARVYVKDSAGALEQLDSTDFVDISGEDISGATSLITTSYGETVFSAFLRSQNHQCKTTALILRIIGLRRRVQLPGCIKK